MAARAGGRFRSRRIRCPDAEDGWTGILSSYPSDTRPGIYSRNSGDVTRQARGKAGRPRSGSRCLHHEVELRSGNASGYHQAIDRAICEREDMIRVLVAEDSPTARALLVAMLDADPEIEVIAQASTGLEAVEMAERLEPDLITMDVHMPELDGLAATERIMLRSPCPIIIVSSQARDADVSLSLDATRAGALLVLPKPEGPGPGHFDSD